MFYTVYKVTNTINGKYYIGKHQTKDLNDGYMGSGINIKRAIKKYGIDNFQKEILFVFNDETSMNAKEKELVNLDEMSYNICPGGKGGFGYIIKNKLHLTENHSNAYKRNFAKGTQKVLSLLNDDTWCEEWKKKISAGLKQHYLTNDGSFKDKKHTKKTKEKISNAMRSKTRGKNNSQYGTMWITNGSENRKLHKEEDIPSGWKRGRVCK